MKKNNRDSMFFDETEKWYTDAAFSALDSIAGSESALEVNTGGVARGTTSTVYPSPWILKECSKRGIPVFLNSDAHNPENLIFHFEESFDILKNCGFSSVRILHEGKFKDIPIK